MDSSGNGSKKFIGTVIVAILLFISTTGFYSTCTSRQAVQQTQLEGAVREGTPEFEALTKRIVIQTDENNTMQSPTGMGTITMFIRGKIRNFTGKTLTGLEIKTTVIDQLEKPVKEKTLIVVPNQKERFEPNETMPVSVMIEGFSKDDDRAMIRWKVTAIRAE
ncbi:MAG: hypothetical protein M3384_16910 [Acidobacteriota bacterium]|nr:hypothetical protein [Acidobacteriota bacterium]